MMHVWRRPGQVVTNTTNTVIYIMTIYIYKTHVTLVIKVEKINVYATGDPYLKCTSIMYYFHAIKCFILRSSKSTQLCYFGTP